MSRIGKMPVPIPSGVTVTIEGRTIRVKGPKGELSRVFRPEIDVSVKDGKIIVERHSDVKRERAFHGLTRALIANMVTGVASGYQKNLEIVGVGYKAEKKGEKLVLTVGYSHVVEYPEPPGITLAAPSPTTITIAGADKERVGQVAAELRGVRPPEPYKGKGIRYQGEYVRRKAGKTGAK
jgi:large subunit ribosomal protein L6